MNASHPDSAVAVRSVGMCGRITLDRPEALNALTAEMVGLIDAGLDQFEDDPNIATVVIDGSGERAFCAGGDIRSIYDSMLAGDPAPRRFWAEEYRLNSRIARFPKPVVAIMDGIVMGGGVGLSAHASHRIVTERSTIAMPEVGIGFAPDVGGTWLLSLAGPVGTHLALTTRRIGAADAIQVGLADSHVRSHDVPSLLQALRRTSAEDAITAAASEAPAGDLPAERWWIDEGYSQGSLLDIVRSLRQLGREAEDAASEILTKSPIALSVALRALREARECASLEKCLEMEYRISTTFLETPDFAEGVRAAVVDKDRSPRWSPSDIRDVSDEMVNRFFVPRADELLLSSIEASR
jgi:enoyl-CoA hydratase